MNIIPNISNMAIVAAVIGLFIDNTLARVSLRLPESALLSIC